MTYPQFKAAFIGFLVSGILGLGAMVWTANAATLADTVKKVSEHDKLIERLTVLQEEQVRTNDRLERLLRAQNIPN